jgi:hypothetical protein
MTLCHISRYKRQIRDDPLQLRFIALELLQLLHLRGHHARESFLLGKIGRLPDKSIPTNLCNRTP